MKTINTINVTLIIALLITIILIIYTEATHTKTINRYKGVIKRSKVAFWEQEHQFNKLTNMKSVSIGDVYEDSQMYHVSFVMFDEIMELGDTLFFITKNDTRAARDYYWVVKAWR